MFRYHFTSWLATVGSVVFESKFYSRCGTTTSSAESVAAVSDDRRAEKFSIVSNDHGCTQKCDFCFICRFSPSSFASPGLLCNIQKFGAKKIFYRPSHTMKKLHSFRDSHLVCKMYDCYCRVCKRSSRNIPFLPFQKMQGIRLVTIGRLDENKRLQNVSKRI